MPKYRIRQLINGKFVAELKRGFWPFVYWTAIDLREPKFTWSPSSAWYRDCMGTEEECKRALASRGF